MKTEKLSTATSAQEIDAAAAAKQNGANHGARLALKNGAENGKVIVKLNGKVNILLVDDRKDKLLALGAILAPLNQNVVEAHSGKEALRLLLKNEFAVILMDVSMPTMDGFETAALIRRRPATEHTPIIFVTSIGNSPTQMYQGYSLGAVDYILTPIIPEVLRAKVSVFVDLWRKTEHIKQQSERLRQVEEAEHRRRLAEAEDKLEAETKRNRFFTLALDLLGIGDFEGRLLQVNPSWESVLGYSQEELRGATVDQFVHPEDLPMIFERVQLLKKGMPVEYFEVRCKHKDGTYRWIGWTAAAFPAEKLIYIFGRNVTARKLAEDQVLQLNGELEKRITALTEVNRELETFNYSISHDLRAPLRSMSGFAQALIDGAATRLGEQEADYVRRIAKSAKRMDTLLQDLLEYSRVSRAAMPPMTVNLDSVVNEILSLREREIQDKQARIEVKSPLGVVSAHTPTIQQILSNLIDNGLKFVGKDQAPHVWIWTEPVAEGKDSPAENGAGKSARVNGHLGIRIWVEDNGIGIEKEFHEKIFGLFERLHPSHAFPGTGLGLAIVRKAVERMGGRVGLESQPEKGSKFWVELPVSPAEGRPVTSG
ncbi:MAG TPA: ATP-binding protein [Candidatus Angelobacter sp.]|nr:ATP-binding protein [Candidatus Angelobacter sp.]